MFWSQVRKWRSRQMKTHRKDCSWVWQPVGCCFLIRQCLNKARMQEEVEKDLAYLTDVYLYTIPDKGLWEIYVLIRKNESFSNWLRLVRSFLDWHVSSWLLKCLSVTASRERLQGNRFSNCVCGSTSGCAHMYVGVSTTKKSRHRVFCWFIHRKESILLL